MEEIEDTTCAHCGGRNSVYDEEDELYYCSMSCRYENRENCKADEQMDRDRDS